MTDEENKVEAAINAARASWSRISSQPLSGGITRIREWITKAAYSAFAAISGIVLYNNHFDLGIPDIYVTRVAVVTVGVGSLSLVYFCLQIFLDGLLSRMLAVRSLGTLEVKSSEPSKLASSSGNNKVKTTPTPRLAPRHIRVANIIRVRLRSEIENQGTKAQVNLGMGVVTAFSSIGFLCWLAWGVSQPINFDVSNENASKALQFWKASFWALFASKVALSFTASVFSFFFLSTYRRNLGEIKYFQNEMTNIELKIFAVYMADESDMSDVVKSLLLKLGDTERNFIIKSGEKTIEMHSRDLDSGDYNASLSSLLKSMPFEYVLKQKTNSDPPQN